MIKNTPAPWEWRPFASAPKDRTEILVYRPDVGVFTALYTPARADDGEEDDDNWCWFTTTGEDIDDYLPTHWMPIPNGPDVADTEDGARAFLIAAAPDLLAACIGAVEMLTVMDVTGEVVDTTATRERLRAAITKAKGDSWVFSFVYTGADPGAGLSGAWKAQVGDVAASINHYPDELAPYWFEVWKGNVCLGDGQRTTWEGAVAACNRVSTWRTPMQTRREQSAAMSETNPVEEVLRTAVLYVEDRRNSMGVTATDASQDWRFGGPFKLLGEAVNALQTAAKALG